MIRSNVCREFILSNYYLDSLAGDRIEFSAEICMGIEQNLTHLRQLISTAERDFQRQPGSVLLLAVSKQQSPEAIAQAYHLGVSDFAENYFQEGQTKINALGELPITWHFIGPIQTNKCKGIASHYDWVHSVNRAEVAKKLNDNRPAHLAKLNVCLQINLVEEETKAGIPPNEALQLAKIVTELPHLQLRGLMAIPPPAHDSNAQYLLFLQLQQLLADLNQQLGLNMDTLSMGMSDDFIPAIKAGATIIRIGQALFGQRTGKTA